MKSTSLPRILSRASFLFFFISYFTTPLSHAIDLNIKTETMQIGGTSSGEESGSEFEEEDDSGVSPASQKVRKVQVMNVPLDVKLVDQTKVHEIAAEASLPGGEVYKSEYIDVRDYKQMAIYVKPQRTLTKISEKPQNIHYQVEAFFSLEPGSATADSTFGFDQQDNPGWKEFGHLISEGDLGQKSLFTIASTGETSNRVLFIPVYGPYVRVELKNLSTETKPKKFRITAYLIQ